MIECDTAMKVVDFEYKKTTRIDKKGIRSYTEAKIYAK